MDTNESNTHADPLLGSRWAQMWVHMWAQTLVIFLVYVTKGNTYTSHFMEIQQRDNETLAAYVHHFKMEAKRCDFNIDTAAICILIKGLSDAQTITAKEYEKDPHTLPEVIKLVEKLNTAQQVYSCPVTLYSEHVVK